MPGAVAFPVAWIDTVDEVEIQRLLDSKGVIAGREIAVYGDGDVDAAAFVTRLGSARHRRSQDPRGRGSGLGRRRGPAARAPAELRQARRHRLAPRGARRWPARGGPERPLPAVPRQLRGARGVRRGPHPGCPVPRHQLARGPGRLEPTLTRGDRRRAAGSRHHEGHDHRGLRPRHGGRRQREMAGPAGRADRGDPCADDPALRRGRRRPPAGWRLRLVGAGRQSARDRSRGRRHRCRRSAPRCRCARR